MRPLDLPRVGRYRLYDLGDRYCADCGRIWSEHVRLVKYLQRRGERLHAFGAGRRSNRVRCRLCSRWFKRDNAWRHWATEHGRIRGGGTCLGEPCVLEAPLREKLLRRRKERHRKHSQYEYATGGDRATWKP